MICSYLICPFPIVIIFVVWKKKKVDLFFVVDVSVEVQGQVAEASAPALIATSLLLRQATEAPQGTARRGHRLTAPGGDQAARTYLG